MLPESPISSPARVLGLTGAIGSGKSAVGSLFTAQGVPCLDADLVARAIHQDPEHPATVAIAAAFPQGASTSGALRRGTLRHLFAHDPHANALLKRLLAPHVLLAAQHWTAQQNAPYVVWESALLLDQAIVTDRVLVVDAPATTRAARIAQRNPDWTAAHIAAVMAMQAPSDTYLAAADDIIDNQHDLAALALQVAQLHAAYLTQWSH